jgi:hypothetical protein
MRMDGDERASRGAHSIYADYIIEYNAFQIRPFFDIESPARSSKAAYTAVLRHLHAAN